MVQRRGVNRETVVELVARSLDKDLLNLRPFLVRGPDGFRDWFRQLRFVLELNGGSQDDVVPLMRELGVDTADIYRQMLMLQGKKKGK